MPMPLIPFLDPRSGWIEEWSVPFPAAFAVS